MFRDSMTRNCALTMFEAMLMILASHLALAKVGARIGHVRAWARRTPIGFLRLTTLLPLPVPGADRGERFAAALFTPCIRLRPNEPSRKPGAPHSGVPSFDMRSKERMSVQPAPE
jgi:hypothetical protein